MIMRLHIFLHNIINGRLGVLLFSMLVNDAGFVDNGGELLLGIDVVSHVAGSWVME